MTAFHLKPFYNSVFLIPQFSHTLIKCFLALWGSKVLLKGMVFSWAGASVCHAGGLCILHSCKRQDNLPLMLWVYTWISRGHTQSEVLTVVRQQSLQWCLFSDFHWHVSSQMFGILNHFVYWLSHWEQPRWKMLLGFFCTLEKTTFALEWFKSSHSSYSVLMFLHWTFIIFIHNFSILGLIIPSLDVLPLFSASLLMKQVEELNCKFRTIPSLAGATQEAPHRVQRPLTKACLLSQEPVQFFSFPTSERDCFKNTFSGMLTIYF